MGAANMIVKEEKPAPSQSVTVRFPPELLDEVDAIAKREGVKRTALVLGLLRYALDEKRKGAKIKVLV